MSKPRLPRRIPLRIQAAFFRALREGDHGVIEVVREDTSGYWFAKVLTSRGHGYFGYEQVCLDKDGSAAKAIAELEAELTRPRA